MTTETTKTPAISIRGISKYYRGRRALNQLTLDVQPGEVFGLVGPNGAGKTTLISIICGLIRPKSGIVSVFGYDIVDDFERSIRCIGAVFDRPAFYPYLTGWQNLALLARLSNEDPNSDIANALAFVGLTERQHSLVSSYSFGMRQRLNIAQAIVHRPQVVLMDEPTNGLDPAGINEFRVLVGRMNRELGTTIFLSTHLLSEVEQICSRIAILNKGEIILCENVSDVISSGSKQTYAISVSDAPKATRLSTQLGWEVIESKDGLIRVRSDSSEIAELVEGLVMAHVSVSSVEASKGLLETVYLQAVEMANHG